MNRAALGAALVMAAGGLWWTMSRAAASTLPTSSPGSALDNASADFSAIVEDTVSALTPGPWSPPSRAAPYVDAIAAAESRYGIPTNLLARLLYQESHYRPEIIDGSIASSAGALGIAQFMPATAADLGIDPLNAGQAIDGAGKYLKQLHDATGSWSLALAAYNWGLGNVQRKGLDAAPLETQLYVAQITGDVNVA